VDGERGVRNVPATLVIGADGVGSRVARDVGAPVLRRGRGSSAVRYAYVGGAGAGGYEWAYGAAAAAGVVPTNDGVACVFVAAAPERMRAAARTGPPHRVLARLLHETAPGLDATVDLRHRVGPVHGWAGLRGFVRQSWGPGWALVGDAGYFKDPISTHGITDALRDAELLAESVVALFGGAPERLALGRYQATRDTLSLHLFDASDAIATYDWQGSDVQPLLRRLTASMADEVEMLERRPPLPGGRRVTTDTVAPRR